MTFDAPLVLALAPLLALLAALGAWIARRRRVRLASAWSAELGRRAQATGRWVPVLMAAVGLLAGVALAGPRWGRTQVTTQTQALSLLIGVDISRSMLAEDVAPNRLDRAVREARRLVQDLEGDRIGLIAFAGRSYILSPLTVDGGAVQLYLDALDPDLASQGGTSLAAALRQGRELLGSSNELADRVLVLFSDAETHDSLGEAVDEAEALKTAGVRLIVVAEGGADPVRIPLRDETGTVVAYKLDDAGRPVETRRDDRTLRAIVEAADGTLVPSDVPDQAGAVRELITSLQRSPTSETRTADLVPRAWIAALIAALLLLGQTIARRTAALVALAGVLLAPAAVAQRPTAGQRALAAGDAERAAAEYLREAHGAARDTGFYNAGTAALRAGRLDVARGALVEAAKSLDPALRYRALYNLGVIGLLEAAADTTRREALLQEASENLREALLLNPASERAKWNLELAEQRKPPPPPSGGGGGGAAPPQSGGGQTPESSAPARPGLSRSQAEQILNSMEREERTTRAEQLERLQGGGSGGIKDW